MTRFSDGRGSFFFFLRFRLYGEHAGGPQAHYEARSGSRQSSVVRAMGVQSRASWLTPEVLRSALPSRAGPWKLFVFFSFFFVFFIVFFPSFFLLLRIVGGGHSTTVDQQPIWCDALAA